MTKPTLCRAEVEWCLETSEVETFVSALKSDPQRLLPGLSANLSLADVEVHECEVAGYQIVRAVFRAGRPPFESGKG